MRINKAEKLFLILNACIAGLGTAAGVAFPSLAFLGVWLGFTGAALLAFSIGGVIFFSMLGLGIGFYFFYKVHRDIQKLIKKIEHTEEKILEAWIDYVLIKKNVGFKLVNPLRTFIATDNAEEKIFSRIRKKISSTIKSLDDKNVEKIKKKLQENEDFQQLFKSYNQLISQVPQNNFSFLDAPLVHGSVNSFISYGSLLGPCAGLVGAITSMGLIGGMATIGAPVAATLVVASLLLTLLTVYFARYSEARNHQRSGIINETEKRIDAVNEAGRMLLFHALDQKRTCAGSSAFSFPGIQALFKKSPPSASREENKYILSSLPTFGPYGRY